MRTDAKDDEDFLVDARLAALEFLVVELLAARMRSKRRLSDTLRLS